jgi:putative endonuclease
MSRTYWVYITCSWSRCLYIGVTGDLVRRAGQHKKRLPPTKGFTSLYRAHRLVYMEGTQDVHAALAREKQLKRWRRERKIALISAFNPQWLDLAARWPEIEWPR